jgi:hypothetical protein
MKKLGFITATGLLLTVSADSYSQILKGWKYANHTQAGIAIGSSTDSYTGTTVHGIKKNGWMTGVGTGFDAYGMKGIPLVAHVQKSFFNSRNKPFVYSQMGVLFPVRTDEWKAVVWLRPEEEAYDLNTGYIGEIGGGYLVGLGKSKKHSLSISAGFSYKQANADYKQILWPPHISSIPPQSYDEYLFEKHTYHYKRLVLKVGFVF